MKKWLVYISGQDAVGSSFEESLIFEAADEVSARLMALAIVRCPSEDSIKSCREISDDVYQVIYDYKDKIKDFKDKVAR